MFSELQKWYQVFPSRFRAAPNSVIAAEDSFSAIIPCPRVNGSATELFCCSARAQTPAADAGCCDRAIFVDIGHGPVRSEASAISTTSPSQIARLSSTATALTSTETFPTSSSIPASANIPAPTNTPASTTSGDFPPAAVTSLPQTSPSSKKNVQVGVGIGVSLGVSLISVSVIFLIHERRLRIKAQKQVIDTLAAYDNSRATGTPVRSYQIPRRSRPQEIEHTQPQPGELYDGEIHEVDVRG